MADILFIVVIYLVLAIPAFVVMILLHYLLIRKLNPSALKIGIASSLITILFTPMLSGGGAALITYPAPSYIHVADIFLIGSYESFTWHFDKYPLFIIVSSLITFVSAIVISYKLYFNNSFDSDGANDAPPG